MGEYPVNQSAIKMLNKLVEAHPAPIVAQALPDIMPGLVKVTYSLYSAYINSCPRLFHKIHTKWVQLS